MIKLKIIKIEGYNYTLEKTNGEIFIKNIEFLSEIKPNINDILYMPVSMLNDDMLTYGNIDENDINENDLLIIENENKKLTFKRLYG